MRFVPSIYVTAFNYFSDEKVSAGELNVSFAPFTVDVSDFSYRNAKGELLISSETGQLSAHAIAWFNDKHNFWTFELAGADVQLENLPESTDDDSEESATADEKLNIHELVSGLRTIVSGVTIQLDANTSVKINRFNTQLNDTNLSDFTKIEQDIDFSVDYITTAPEQAELLLEGVIQSRIKDGVSKITLIIPALDVNSILSSVQQSEGSIDESVNDLSVDSASEPAVSEPDSELIVETQAGTSINALSENSTNSSENKPLATDSQVTANTSGDVAEPITETEEVVEEIVEEEALIDWEWMSMFEPFEFDLKIAELSWSDSEIRDLELLVAIDQSIKFSHSSHVKFLDSEEFSFDDQLTLSGELNPISSATLGADLQTNLELNTSNLTLSVNGDINVNGADSNNMSVSLETTGLPISTNLDEETLTMAEQYFPIKTQFDVELLSDVLTLNIADATFGESDIRGTLVLNSQNDDIVNVKAELSSKQIGFKTPLDESVDENAKPSERKLKEIPTIVEGEESNEVAVQEAVVEEEADNGERIFNDDVIDWAWLDPLKVNISFQAEKAFVDDIEVTKLNVPLSINNNVITIDGLAGELASGDFTLNSTLNAKAADTDLNLVVKASDIVLEQLNLLPPEELQRAVTGVAIELTASGNTSRALASSLNGDVKINVGDGVIGNDSFELIGSDLILGLLNKLNPFAKADKTTDLECAVVNLNIENGKIDIDKSIALRTSKLTMVANGYVDLSKEKIKLSLTPKARSGVGVDASSLVKFIALGGTLAEPAPVITASGVLKSAAIVGAAISTGGVSLLATNVAEKALVHVDVCKRADTAFDKE